MGCFMAIQMCIERRTENPSSGTCACLLLPIFYALNIDDKIECCAVCAAAAAAAAIEVTAISFHSRKNRSNIKLITSGSV